MNTLGTKDLKVLVVEDEAILALNLCNTLNQYGYISTHTNSGESAIQLVQNYKPNIILMDIRLGDGIDGIDTAIEIQKSFQVPIIFLTAYSDQTTLERAQITEPFGYIIKPFQAREVYITIELAIYKSRSIKTMNELQQKLFESQRVESIGLLSSGIAHEINNPLMAILNFSILGREKADESGSKDIAHYFETVHTESEKIAVIVKNLVNFAREEGDHWIYQSLTKLIQEMLSLFHQMLINDGITVDLVLDPDIPEIYCKPQRVKQAFLNIISFCRTSILGNKESKEKWIKIQVYTSTQDGKDFVTVEVSDSGKGFREHILEYEDILTDPYEKNYALPGLGYNLSKAIVHEHNGKIDTMTKGKQVILIVSLPLNQ